MELAKPAVKQDQVMMEVIAEEREATELENLEMIPKADIQAFAVE